MAIVATNPRTLHGPWSSGFALDWHTLGSTPVGHNAFGHMQFDTTRPPVGQLLYELKYKSDDKQGKADDLADTAADFLRRVWKLKPDAIVPVPPSNNRAVQPVTLVVNGLSARLGVPVCTACLAKVKQTPQLKDIKDYDRRREVLKGAFQANPEHCKGRNLLLFDDLHGSGATTGHIAEVLKAAGARAVYLLTLTMNIFIGGSIGISKLNSTIHERLDEFIQRGDTILIGDANGADKAVQTYLAHKDYPNVTVFCMEVCRNNIGQWPVRHVEPPIKKKDSKYYAAKDLVMFQEARCGVMLWDAKSKGTLQNMLNLVGAGKRTLVYFAPSKEFQVLATEQDLQALLSRCSPRDLDDAARKLGLKIPLTQPHLPLTPA